MTTTLSNGTLTLDALLALPREERIERLHVASAVDDAVIRLGDEAERLVFTAVSRSLAATEMLVDLADLLCGGRARARVRRARSQALAYSGRHEEALATCEAAIRIAEESGERIEAARARLGTLHPLGEFGRYDEAVRAGEEAYAMLMEAGEPALAARADVNLGGIHQNRDDPRRALFHLDRARTAFQADPVILGYIENNRGEALLLLNDFEGAEQAYAAALDAALRSGASVAAAIAEGNLAEMAARQGRMQDALHRFEQARRRFEQDAARSHLARLRMEQAETLELLGLHEDALATYEDAAAQLDRHGLAWDAARAGCGAGRCLLRLGRLDDADARLAEAADGFEALGHAASAQRANLIRCELALRRGDDRLAERLLGDAEEAFAGRPLDTASACHARARLLLARGDATGAHEALTAAIDLVAPLDIAPLLADLLHARGAAQRRAGRLHEALGDLRAAVRQVERVRGGIHAERLRTSLLGDRYAAYDELVAVTLERGGARAAEEALLATEQARCRTLLDLVGGGRDDGRETGDGAADAPGSVVTARGEDLRARAARLHAELNALYSRLTDQRADRVAADRWRESVHQRERELASIEDRLAAERSAGTIGATAATLDELFAALAPGTALVSYFSVGGEFIAFVLRDGEVTVQRGLASAEQAAEDVQRLQFQIGRALRPGALAGGAAGRMAEDARRALGALHDRFWRPLAARLDGVQRAVVAPHGVMHAAPLHAMWDGEAHLVERMEFAYAPSASVLCQLRAAEQDGDAGGAPLIVGVADQAAPQIAQEISAVKSLLPGATTLTGPEATAERVRAAAGTARLLHFACHGQFAPRTPQASGLKLHDRWLTVRDLRRLRLRAALATLSGCNTGRSVVQAGDEMLGLSQALLSAGARRLLVSLWKVDDASTAKLMSEFYRRYRGGAGDRGGAAALREAQCVAIGEQRHAALWAPFILVGNP